MKSVFITKLTNLQILENLGAGEKLGDSLKITNDRTRIEQLLASEHREILGKLETSAILDGSPIVYSECEIPKDLTRLQFLNSQLYAVQGFLTTVWVFRDNAINFELGFVLCGENLKHEVTSNLIGVQNSTARGEVIETKMSRDELREIREFHRKEIMPIGNVFGPPISQLIASSPRFSRALYFIAAARAQSDIAIKIAHYCTAFETLFSSSQTELSHQLSERISFYVHNSCKERLESYKMLKAAYTLRSKVVHGATIKESKMEDCLKAVEYCDTVARVICRKAFMEKGESSLFRKDQEEFEEAILRMIFGETTA